MTRSSATRLEARGARPRGVNSTACHKMIRDTAVQMAHQCYQALMLRNDWYALWRSEVETAAQRTGLSPDVLEKTWVNTHWASFIEGARAALAETLRQPIDDGLRDAIAEALILDATLTHGRKAGLKLAGAMQNA